MESIEMAKDLESIVKEGFLEKESRFFKSWRKRWFVLTQNTLYSFKERKVYTSPTQIVPLKSITAIKSCDDEGKEFIFRVDTYECSFLVGATSNVEKEQWIGQIGKAMVKLNTREQDYE